MVVHVIVFVVILEQGRVYSCGENKSGQLGTGEQSASAPVVIPTKVCLSTLAIYQYSTVI